MSTLSSVFLGSIACGRGLRRSRLGARTNSEYDVWVSEHDASEASEESEESSPRPVRRERALQLSKRDPSSSSSRRPRRRNDGGKGS